MSEMSRYSLDDLAERTELTQRSIRHYISLGLLPGPEALGRNAWYSDQHLDRLQCIKVLREATGASLSDLRPVLNSLTEGQIRDIATGVEKVMTLPVGAPSRQDPTDSSFKRSDHRPMMSAAESTTPKAAVREELDALAYIRNIRAGQQYGDTSRLAGVVRELQRVTGRRVHRRSRNEWWATVPITPDIEIRARGLNDNDIGELERLADLIRHLLMKGSEE